MGRSVRGLAAVVLLCAGVASSAFAETKTYRYDVHGRLVEVVGSDGIRSSYAYDAAGNRTSMTRETGASSLATADFAATRGYGDQNVHPRFLADVNGDGRKDMVAVGNEAVYVALANADGTFATTIVGAIQFTAGQSWANNNLTPRAVADVNGDGRADMIGFASDAVYVALGQANGTFGAVFKAIDGYGVTVGGWTNQDAVPRLVGDVNGDGRADIVGFAYGSVQVALGQANGTFAAPFEATQEFVYAATWGSMNVVPRVLADVNGDGRADIVGFASDGVIVALAQPGGTFAPGVWATVAFGVHAGSWTSQEAYPRFVADVNGDGRADVVGFGIAAVYIALGQANGTFGAMTSHTSSFIEAWGGQAARPRLVGDTNGDGRADLLAVGADGVYRQPSPF
ncbi:FG-GAP-like repeat-containing protein [Caulobacter endophyticus]|uniref:YD repeat-containing protein n=1 Tax=Caulobacter endophyticus TaxID=2172652 RepID=A0A2T9KDE2_9CAUL|nr:FG-GAP-like repeat-containing protein [Caulobacter endophyticus]PVM93996.1 hypothetical protein DDF67_01735 [Caulobacter endophyticus]